MEEISCMKEKIASIFESNDKVLQILQEWEVNKSADEEQSRRIRDLKYSFQRLEKRIEEGDNEFQELENMVRDLGLKVERAATLLRNYKHLKRDRRRSGDQSITHDQRESDLSSKLPLRRNKNDTKTEHSSESVATITQSKTEIHKRKKKVRFVEDSDIDGAESENSYKSKTIGPSGDKKKVDDRNSQNVHFAVRIPKSDTGFKRKLTKQEGDNRLRYHNSDDMRKRDTKHIASGGKDEKRANGKGQDVSRGSFTNLIKDENMLKYMKDELSRQSDLLMKSCGLEADPARACWDETWKLAIEQPDLIEHFVKQEGHQPMGTLFEDNMSLIAVIEKMADRAEKEKEKGAKEQPPRGLGPDTVLCLDTSGSMEGVAFREMISLAIKFVDGIQDVSRLLGIEENIAVSTFGKTSGVPLHLTNQYNKVKNLLLSLKPEGPSPLFEGIHMALAACEGNGRRVTMSGIPVGTRIILISDGKGTPDQWRLSEDKVDPNNAKAKILVNSNMIAAGQLVKSSGHTVYSVPVGDYTEGPLERVARLSGGEVIRRHELGRLIQHAQHQSEAASVVHQCRGLDEDVDREPFLRAFIDVKSTTPGESNYNQSKMDVLTLALKYNQRQDTGLGYFGDKGDVMEEVNSYMPCIGKRVRRGPTWHWGNQDNGGPGTVVGHDSDSMVWVEWDISGNRNVYHYVRGYHDVTVVEEERTLTADEDIGVGCKVKRGNDWTFGDQDVGDGTVGVVCRVIPARFVHVRWPNKTLKKYRFGDGGCFEVELINRRHGIGSASILPSRPEKGSTTDKTKEARTDMSVEDMNRLNQRK